MTIDDATAEADRLYAPFIRKSSDDPYHHVFAKFAYTYMDGADLRILEIGSREVSGYSRRRLFPKAEEYVGIDILPGPGVDLVLDAHDLTRTLPVGHFDGIFSFSVFEHLVFPWKVVMEVNRLLKPGGYCFVSTHPAWPPHELPWDFWRFPAEGLKALFSRPLGFEVCDVAEGVLGRLHSLAEDPPTRGVSGFDVPLAVALTARKVANYDPDRFRWDTSIFDSVATSYPKQKDSKPS